MKKNNKTHVGQIGPGPRHAPRGYEKPLPTLPPTVVPGGLMAQMHNIAYLSDVQKIIRLYIREVNRRAEENMLKTGRLEGSHHAAMKLVAKELGVEA